MCRKLAAAALILSLGAGTGPGIAQAQEDRWDLFVTGGWSRGQLNGGGDKLLGEDDNTGFTAGAAAQLRIYDEFAIDLGLRYTQKGGRGTIDSTFSIPNFSNVTMPIGNAKVDLDYIEIPLLFAFVLDTSYNSYLRAYFGPSLNILVSSHVTGVSSGQTIDTDIDDLISSTDWTGVVGASWNYDFGSWQALADGRWVIGLTSIDDTPADSDLKTQTWEFSLGVGIPLATD